MEQIDQLSKLINKATSIVILTGAGVSTASGIPDFRSTDGRWTADHSREFYTSREYFLTEPEDFWLKYKEIFRIKLLKDYQPNKVHTFLSNLETLGKKVSIVTQNVDGLHSLAGNEQDVIEYHGNLNTATCPKCGKKYDLPFIMKEDVPVCIERGCHTILKPDIVLYGDPITKHSEAERAIELSELMLVLGTSLLVTPFSLLPSYAKQMGLPMVIINRESTPMDYLFDLIIHEELVSAVEQLEERL